MNYDASKYAYPSIKGTSLSKSATRAACCSGFIFDKSEVAEDVEAIQITNKRHISPRRHPRKNQCWRRSFKPAI